MNQGSYAILFFTASDFTSITSHLHNWVFFLLWLCLFILSGVISPLFSSGILGTYLPGEFLFQYPIILPFHTVHSYHQSSLWLTWSQVPSFFPFLSTSLPTSLSIPLHPCNVGWSTAVNSAQQADVTINSRTEWWWLMGLSWYQLIIKYCQLSTANVLILAKALQFSYISTEISYIKINEILLHLQSIPVVTAESITEPVSAMRMNTVKNVSISPVRISNVKAHQ